MLALFIPVLPDRKSTRLNSSHSSISYAVFCLKKQIEGVRDDVRRRLGMLGEVADLGAPVRGKREPRQAADLKEGQADCDELFFFREHGDHRDLHPFPTRRSSD